MAFHEWRALGDVIPLVLRDWEGVADSPLRRVADKWQAIVGAEVARHALPYAVRDRKLLLLVESAVWGAELSGLRAPQIIEAVNEVLGGEQIRALRCLTRRSTRRDVSTGDKHAENANDV